MRFLAFYWLSARFVFIVLTSFCLGTRQLVSETEDYRHHFLVHVCTSQNLCLETLLPTSNTRLSRVLEVAKKLSPSRLHMWSRARAAVGGVCAHVCSGGQKPTSVSRVPSTRIQGWVLFCTSAPPARPYFKITCLDTWAFLLKEFWAFFFSFFYMELPRTDN